MRALLNCGSAIRQSAYRLRQCIGDRGRHQHTSFLGQLQNFRATAWVAKSLLAQTIASSSTRPNGSAGDGATQKHQLRCSGKILERKPCNLTLLEFILLYLFEQQLFLRAFTSDYTTVPDAPQNQFVKASSHQRPPFDIFFASSRAAKTTNRVFRHTSSWRTNSVGEAIVSTAGSSGHWEWNCVIFSAESLHAATSRCVTASDMRDEGMSSPAHSIRAPGWTACFRAT
jgi:hypothetical protein